MKLETYDYRNPNSSLSLRKKDSKDLCNLTINYSAQCAEVNGKNIHLTRLEYKTLVYLVERSNTAISRDELLKVIWQLPCQIETRATDDTIKRLRKKLKAYKVNLNIETIRGFGFIIKS
ncbi:winged helix-turn-helix domain-containing protein [Fusibacter bizertensis]